MLGHTWEVDIIGLGRGLDIGCEEKDVCEAFCLSNRVNIGAIYSNGDD